MLKIASLKARILPAFLLSCVLFTGPVAPMVLAAETPTLLSGQAVENAVVTTTEAASDTPSTTAVATPSEPYLVNQRRSKGINRIFQFDKDPLGNRTPVILIPGRAEEFQPSSWWKKFNQFGKKDSDYKQRFKTYVYVYNSKLELEEQTRDFNRDFKLFFGNVPTSQSAILVTYSLGGMIGREALKDPSIFEKTLNVFAIAVPFHGSPIFDPDWFTQYMNPPNRSPIRTAWDRFVYRAYLFNKSNLTRGLKSDNFDNALPQFDLSTVHVNGDQVLHKDSPYIEHPAIPNIKKKMIIYASYLENGYTKSNQPLNPVKLPKYVLDKSADLPIELLGTVLPAYGLSVHSVFTYMNHQLANLPTFTPENPEGKNIRLYRFNDGALPLSSMLYLPSRTQPYTDDFEGLIKAMDVPKARVFVNIDHMHIGEYAIRKGRIKTKDILSPSESEKLGARRPTEWLLYDIKNLVP